MSAHTIAAVVTFAAAGVAAFIAGRVGARQSPLVAVILAAGAFVMALPVAGVVVMLLSLQVFGVDLLD